MDSLKIPPNLQLADEFQVNDLLEVNEVLDASTFDSSGSKAMTFRAVVPSECVKGGDSSVGIVFYFIRDSEFHLLNLASHVRLERVAMVGKRSFRVYLVEVELPIISSKRRTFSFYYTYRLQSAGAGQQLPENLLLKGRELRQSNFPAESLDGQQWVREDGLVHFGQPTASETDLKTAVLDVIVQLETLDSREIMDPTKHAELLSSLMLVWQCLCVDDKTYRAAFQKLLQKEFLKIADEIGQRPEYESVNLLALITMFLCTHTFKMQLFDDANWHNYVFGCHQLNNHSIAYFASLQEYFRDAERTLMNKALKSFLRANSDKHNLVNGVNALVVYYFLNKSSQQSLAKMLGSAIKAQDEQQIKSSLGYLQAYTSLTIGSDRMLTMLVLNYFTLTKPKLLKAVLADRQFPFDFLVHLLKTYYEQIGELKQPAKKSFEVILAHIQARINDKCDPRFLDLLAKMAHSRADGAEKKGSSFSDPRERQFPFHLAESHQTLISELLAQQRLMTGLFEQLVAMNSAESDLILQLLSVCLGLVSLEPGAAFSPESQYFRLSSSVKKWLRTRFKADLAKNYGLRSSSLDEPSNMMQTDEQWTATDEPEIYGELLRLSVNMDQFCYSALIDDFKRKIADIFKKRLEHEIKSDFYKFLKVRIRLDFDRFGSVKDLTKDDFIQKFDNTVCDYLISNDSFEQIETLCDTLKGAEYQELLWHYVNSLFEARRAQSDLEFMLKWNNFSSICKLNFETKNRSKPISPKWKSRIVAKLKAFAKAINNITRANESLYSIKSMSENMANSLSLFQVISTHLSSEIGGLEVKCSEDLEKLIAFRMKEAGEFERYRASLARFLPFCQLFRQIDTTSVQRELNELSQNDDLDKQSNLSQFVDAMPLDQLLRADLNSYVPKVVHFRSIDDSIMTGIDKIINLDRNRCVLFDDFFTKACESTGGRQRLDCRGVIEHVWPRALQDWQRLASSFDQALVTLAGVEAFLANYFNNNYANMYQELTYWLRIMNISNLAERSSQIELYGRFRSIVTTARAVHDLRAQLGIANEFAELNDFLALNEQLRAEWTIAKMTSETRRTVDALDTVNSDDKLSCLRAFVESMDCVSWLRTNSRSLVELKVFVELVLSSAENNDSRRLQFAKILKEAGTAYASLIYGLVDSSCSFGRFMGLCRQVMSYLDMDRSIAEKLRIVNQHIGLLEEIRNQRGNVQTNALTLTKFFNSHGTYAVGNLARRTRGQQLLKLEDALELKVGDGDVKRYSYDQLKEHQSVLVLIASRKTQTPDTESLEDDEFGIQADYFVQLFDAVCRTAQVYVELVNAGCSLFRDYTISVSSSSIVDSAGLSLTVGSGAAAEYLGRMVECLEQCSELWDRYIDELRSQFDHLNYFTMNQLEFLKTEIASIVSSSDHRNVTSMLKDLLRYFCDPASLTASTIREAFQTLANHPASFDRSKYQQLLSGKRLTSCELIHDTFDQRWKAFMESQEVFNRAPSMEVDQASPPDHQTMSLEGLAALFSALERRSSANQQYQRAVPEYLVHRGKPNLIVCSNERAQIPIVLSIYAQSFTQAPLPSDDEVLFCNSTTSHEQVVNFIRLAYKSAGDKIFTLVNAHELSYATSGRVEQFLSSNMGLQKSKTSAFVFVVICCQSALQSQSIFALMFAKNKVKPIELAMSDLEEYVDAQLRLPDGLRCALGLPAASTSVKALLSHRSGNGKSSYVLEQRRKMEEALERQAVVCFKTIRIKSLAIDMEQEADKLIQFKSQVTGQDAEGERPVVIYHLDIAFETFKNVDLFLFELVISGCLRNASSGLLWRRDAARDLFFIEMTTPYLTGRTAAELDQLVAYHAMINYLPKINFSSPSRYLYHLRHDAGESAVQDDMFARIYLNAVIQRTCFYLTAVDESVALRESSASQSDEESKRTMLAEAHTRLSLRFAPEVPVISETRCLEILLKSIQNNNCSWMEIANFVRFLDINVEVLESAREINQVPYLRGVVLHFLVIMARDFSVSSLKIEDRDDTDTDMDEDDHGPPRPARQSSRSAFDIASDSEVLFALSRLEVKSDKKWETRVHPLLIFNADRTTMTFMGCYIDRISRKFINPATNRPIEETFADFPDLSAPELYKNLIERRINIFDNFNTSHQATKVRVLCKVLGITENTAMYQAIDANYVLTVDNCLKLMAIYLRLRCNNPVVVSGETGCGKTSLVKFFTDLYLHSLNRPSYLASSSSRTAGNSLDEFLVHAKIHGGTTPEDIKGALEQAVRLSRTNRSIMGAQGGPITTVLFFDEANTTEAVGLVKEIMCDLTCDGEPVDFSHGLKVIAAVNPYRKHSGEMIEKLEHAGLGFYVSADSTKEKLGHIPMRHLVYRVQPLPSSLIPLVWDFGQLERSVEDVYIKRMVEKAHREMMGGAGSASAEVELICKLLSESQRFMRERDDECSFVSLRNIQRALDVAKWFYLKRGLVFEKMNAKLESLAAPHYQSLSASMRAVVLSLAVCYHACLYTSQTRSEYRRLVRTCMPGMPEEVRYDWVDSEISACQGVFFDAIAMRGNRNIARNGALLENVFMMIVCIELRIPLFIVGKPGSSKSLAKSIVAGAMEGINSQTTLFQNLKETYFVNFQCSPLTTSEMIVKAFKEAARLQGNNDADRSVAVVNLDEIGLAEGSEAMPLKALHSLLEEGVPGDDLPAEQRRVGVVGISNWALDPAKMNRGIMVSRGEPDIRELVETAKGICSYDAETMGAIQAYLPRIAEAYLETCSMAREHKREFFGLRDFYGLIKMLYWFCSSDKQFTWHKLEHAVKRNFGGLEIDVLEPFAKRLPTLAASSQVRLGSDPKSSPVDLIRSALRSEHVESNSRYLLFITENETAIDIIQSYLINKISVKSQDLAVIFGSSFRLDQQYSEICRNISLIKNSMEMGKTVILLNSYNLYESLYDALNQYYSEFAGQKYVDLGLGTNRVKCMVHPNFRLILIAEKAAVYDSKRFPIPLVNRLEKHFINSSTMIDQAQKGAVDRLNRWVSMFCQAVTPSGFSTLSAPQVFVGWDADTTATLVMHLTQQVASLITDHDQQQTGRADLTEDEVVRQAQTLLLRCATADSIVRLVSDRHMRLEQREQIWNEYFQSQGHLSLSELLAGHLRKLSSAHLSASASSETQGNLLQVTTHSQSSVLNLNIGLLSSQLGLPDDRRRRASRVDVCLLKAFDTQQQFANRLREFLKLQQENAAASLIGEDDDMPSLMIVQCDMNNKRDLDLITCARHTVVEETKSYLDLPEASRCFLVVLVLSFSREHTKKFIGFQVTHWSCYHLDELDDSAGEMPSLDVLKQKSLVELVSESYSQLTTSGPKLLTRSFSIREGQLERETRFLNIRNLLKRIGCTACSLIVDTNMSRTITRTGLFAKLCDDYDFLTLVAMRLTKLLAEKKEGDYEPQGSLWLVKEAASLKRMNEFSTLRRSCQSYFDAKLSPMLAYILSSIDVHGNMDLYWENIQVGETVAVSRPPWKASLWLKILAKDDLCNIDYSKMRVRTGEIDQEQRNFACKSELLQVSFSEQGGENRRLRPMLPFSWLIVKLISELNSNNLTVLGRQHSVLDRLSNQELLARFSQGLGELVASTSLFEILNTLSAQYQDPSFFAEFLDCYINDFVLTKCKVKNNQEFVCIKTIIRCAFYETAHSNPELENLVWSLTLVHYIYETLESRVDMFLQVTSQDPRVLDHELFAQEAYYSLTNTTLSSNYLNLDLDACRICIQNFESNFRLDHANLRALCQLIQLTSTVIASSQAIKYHSGQREAHDRSLMLSYQKLSILRCFIDMVAMATGQDCRSSSILAFEGLIRQLMDLYLAQDFDFKTKATLERLCSFIQVCRQTVHGIDTKLSQFYLNVLEGFCFNNNEAQRMPDTDAVELVLGQATDSTSQGPFVGQHRPLILQIVFRDHHQLVKMHVKRFMDDSGVASGLFKSAAEIALFYQNCVQDRLHALSKSLSLSERLRSAHQLLTGPSFVKHLPFEKILGKLKSHLASFDVDVLDTLSAIKYCLSLQAEACFEILDRNDAALRTCEEFEAVNQALKHILEGSLEVTDTLYGYLSRQVVRKYGSAYIKLIRSDETLKWMAPDSLVGDFEQSNNKFVIGGDLYDQCEKAVISTFQSSSAKPITDALSADQRLLPYMAMAMYRNVTCLHSSDQPIDKILRIFTDVVKDNEAKIEFGALVHNSFTHELKISRETSSEVELSSLLVQLKFCILFSKSALVKSLAELIKSPSKMAGSYLPTLPQDEFYEIKTAMTTGNSSTTFYTCPNGHTYTVGNCGRPMETSTCKECGAQIGGHDHILIKTNKNINDTIVDKTPRGYCLPPASELPDTLTMDRMLNLEAFHTVRFFLHACLYLACGDDGGREDDVKSLFAGKKQSNLKDFFWSHMKKDLKLIAKALKITQDEVLLLLHRTGFDILKFDPLGSSAPGKKLVQSYSGWQTKSDRQDWEFGFYKIFLAELFGQLPDVIARANQKIRDRAQDSERTKSKFYMMAWELIDMDLQKCKYLYEECKFWKFRPAITFDTLKNALKSTEEHATLKSFVEQIDELEGLIHLPKIAKLVMTLHSNLNKTVFRQTARNFSIFSFLSSSNINLPADQLDGLVDSLNLTWRRVKFNLNKYVANTMRKSLRADVMRPTFSFSRHTALSFFLPTQYGDGFALFALLNYLSSRQNKLIEPYNEQARDRSDTLASSFEQLVSEELVVQFDREKQLIPVVQMNAFVNPDSLQPQFDFGNIESQVVHKFVRAKAVVDTKTIPLFEYSDEMNDYGMFEQLESIVRQESFDEVTQLEIFNEFRNANEISEAFSYLKIIMNYAYTTHAQPEDFISRFLSQIFVDELNLRSAEVALKFKITDRCQLKHLKHAMILLSTKRALLLTQNDQDPFENINPALKAQTNIEWSYNLDPLQLVSTMIVIYQIINLKIVNFEDQDLEIYSQWDIQQIFASLTDLGRNVIISDSISKLPKSFPDSETSGQTMKMKDIYTLWKTLVQRY